MTPDEFKETVKSIVTDYEYLKAHGLPPPYGSVDFKISEVVAAYAAVYHEVDELHVERTASQPLVDALKQEDGWIPPVKVITLCGSTRFTYEMMIKQWELTKQGNIVMGWCALPDDYFSTDNKFHVGDQEGVKKIVDEVHKRKIDISDEILVLNIGGYIGVSTRSEIDYATIHGKAIRYLEPLLQSPVIYPTHPETLHRPTDVRDDAHWQPGDEPGLNVDVEEVPLS